MPSPFLARYLLEWLAAQTMSRAQQAVVDEVKNRVASGELGDYDGVLFKDSFRSKDASGRIKVEGVELGVVGATKRELIGILDKMGVPKKTIGNSFTYYTGSWKGARVAVVETGPDLERAKLGTEALIQAFRPRRVAAVGFATRLSPALKDGALLFPDRLLLEDGSILDLSAPLLSAPENVPNVEAQPSESETPSAPETPDLNAAASSKPAEVPRSFARDLLRRFASGGLLTVDRESVKKSERAELFERTGAAAFDRIAWSVASACAASGVPFLPMAVVRAPNADKVARDAAKLANSTGRSAARTLGAFLGAVSKRPSVALDVYKIKEDSLAAADKLADALGMILTAAKPRVEKSEQS